MLNKLIIAILTLSLTIVSFGAPTKKVVLPLPNYHALVKNPSNISLQALVPNDAFTAPPVNTASKISTTPNSDVLIQTAPKPPLQEHVLIDYDLNDFIGIESEYNKVPTYTFDHRGNLINNHSVELMGKITAPVNDQLSLHAKAGLGYLNNAETDTSDLHTINIAPAYGLEASFKASSHVFLNLSWMHYEEEGDSLNSYQPRSDILSLGLSYKFNDTQS